MSPPEMAAQAAGERIVTLLTGKPQHPYRGKIEM